MRIGFTGTRDGMTEHQKWTVEAFLQHHKSDWVHHGSCVGADYDFHMIARRLGIKIKGHLPINTSLMAELDFDDENKPKPYLSRNADIVNETDYLIACPKEYEIKFKGGTWWTFHYAKKRGLPIIIIWPNGSYSVYNGTKYEL